MGVWHILGTALAAPVRRLDLVWRFFWPVLVFNLGSTIVWATLMLLLVGFLHHLVAEYLAILVASGWLPLAIVSVISIVLTIRGLVGWHRHYTIGEASKSQYRASGDHKGRGWRYFFNGLCLILGYAGVFFVTAILTLIVGSLILKAHMETGEAVSNGTSISSGRLVASFVPNVIMLILPTIIFALVFKRRSLALVFAASDSSANQTAPALSDFALPQPRWSFPLALSILFPFIIVWALTTGLFFSAVFLIHWVEPELIARLQEASANGRPVNIQMFPTGIAVGATSMITVMLLSFVLGLYPILVFATFVSIYYREHVRDQLLASREEKAESAPA